MMPLRFKLGGRPVLTYIRSIMLIARGQKPPAGSVGKGGSYTMALGFAAKAGQLVATELLLSCYLREGAVRM